MATAQVYFAVPQWFAMPFSLSWFVGMRFGVVWFWGMSFGGCFGAVDGKARVSSLDRSDSHAGRPIMGGGDALVGGRLPVINGFICLVLFSCLIELFICQPPGETPGPINCNTNPGAAIKPFC